MKKEVSHYCEECAQQSDGEALVESQYECPDCGKCVCKKHYEELYEECNEHEAPQFERIKKVQK